MTHVSEIVFTLTRNEKIIIPIDIPLTEVNCCTESSIIFIQKNHELVLTNDSLSINIQTMIVLLQKCINQELLLDNTITKDIGYLFNQYSAIICGENLEGPTCVTYIRKNNELYWSGNDYQLWCADYITWLYNCVDGSIIFEVTPFYPYMYCEPEEEPDYIPYKEWIKTYKPYFITTLSREIAEEWLKQAEYIIKNIQDNQKRWELQSKMDVES